MACNMIWLGIFTSSIKIVSNIVHTASGLAQFIAFIFSVANSHLCCTESGTDSGLGSEFSSRSSSESWHVKKDMASLKQTHSLRLEAASQQKDWSIKHRSQPNLLHSTLHKAEPGHKEGLLHDQVFSKLTSKVSTCYIISFKQRISWPHKIP